MTTIERKKGILLVVSGAAGTGKGTVNAILMEKHPDEYAFSVSATTRAPRPGETDGVNYHFISKDEFETMIKNDGLIEYTCYCGNYYGTPKSELSKLDEGKNLILEIETEGAGNIKRIFPDSVTVFILPPDYVSLRNRLVGRGTNTPEDIENRMNKALHEFRLAESYDYTVVNADGKADEAADAIHSIIIGEGHRSARYSGAVDRIFPESIKK
ncbi:MAG: guanylate kinase [Firmicutes bacterium]|nr:guanylate kinase [Candidatus Colimorpha enterica]